MSTKRAILLLTFIITGITILAVWLDKSLPSQSARLDAEREVYSVLFDSNIYNHISTDYIPEIKNHTLVDEYTSLGEARECISEECTQYVIEKLPEIEWQTLTDFQENNNQSYQVKEYFSPAIFNSYVKIDNSKNYERRLSFSRIGFNRFLTQALALVGDCLGDACFDNAGEFMYSMGDFFLLSKIGQKWVVQDSTGYYLSEKPSP